MFVESMPTVNELAEVLTLTTYDIALPRMWREDVEEVMDEKPCYFVWCYDAPLTRGMPRPLTVGAKRLLERYNLVAGTQYPIGFDVAVFTVRPRVGIYLDAKSAFDAAQRHHEDAVVEIEVLKLT